MERLNLRTSGLSYNPAVTQTSCVSLPLWSPFQDVPRSSVFYFYLFCFFLIVLLSHLHKANETSLLVLCGSGAGTFKSPDMAAHVSPWLARSSWEGFHTYLGRHSRDTFLSEQDVNERKTQKIPGLWYSHTHAHAAPLSVHRCWCALHHQIVCKSVQKVTARARVREDPDASGAACTGRTRPPPPRHEGGGVPLLHTTLKRVSSRDAGSQRASECTYEAQAARLCGPPQPALAPTPPPLPLADTCLSPRRE